MTTEIEPDALYLGNATDGMRAHEHPADFDRVITLGPMDSENTTDHFDIPDGGYDFGWNATLHGRKFRDAVATLKGALIDGDTVLVHCTAGQSRSVTVVITTIADLEGTTYNDTYNTVREQRESIHPAPELVKLAKDYLGEKGYDAR